MSNERKTMCITVPIELYEKIRDKADDEERTMSYYVLKALMEYFKDK